MTTRPVTIHGGGLAGLSLGVALARRGVPTRLFEAGQYPRHRVCGEFIAGLDTATMTALALDDVLQDALQLSTLAWVRGGRVLRRQVLARPAFALSRHQLDARLAERFSAAGGELHCGTRARATGVEGEVLAIGRRRGETGWLGLKQHLTSLPLAADLEVHLGDGAYVGLCRVDTSTVNLCGLFRQRPGLALTRETALETYLHASGLASLAERIAPLAVDPASRCAVAGMAFGVPPRPTTLQIGDAYGMIPPFTGHGMAMAFQSAAVTLDPITRWSKGSATWRETVRVCNRALASRLNRPLRVATWLHPFLIAVGCQHLFRFANRTGLVPLRTLTAALHS